MRRVPVRGKGQIFHALVDDADFERIARHNWTLHSAGYAVRRNGRRYEYMHRVVVGDVPEGFEVDHRNGERLDNRRENLRVVTRSQNRHNMHKPPRAASGFRNVSRTSSRWAAEVKVGGRHYYLGTFDDAADAAEVARTFRRLKGVA